jgi:L-asparaginase
MTKARIIIHGGCGAHEDANTTFATYHEHLLPIIQKSHENLLKCDDAIEAALFAANLLEDNPIFNAGTGSRLQQDGQVRMSASIIDSLNNKFAGVVNIQDVQYPSRVAHRLMSEQHSIMGGEMATKFAREKLNIPYHNPITPKRYEEYLEFKKGLTGTIGVIALDGKGVICAVTSTGGVGFEVPGRVGDSATVAGNYATSSMGIACTGIGEQIINLAVAAKTNTRVEDGMDLNVAVNKAIAESNERGYYVGLIALDKFGNIATGSTVQAQALYAYHDGCKYTTFYDQM